MLTGLSKGFEIIQTGSNVQPAFFPNHKSALSKVNRCKVEKQILHEIACNRYVVCVVIVVAILRHIA